MPASVISKQSKSSKSTSSASAKQRSARRNPSSASPKLKLEVRESPSRTYRKEVSGIREDSPAKRKSERYAHVRRVIDELNRHLNDVERRSSKLTILCGEFDHWDEKQHNAELHYGAASVLSLVLTMVTDEEEIFLTLKGLEMVFRGSPQSIQKAYDKVGSSLVPWILQILQKHETGKMKQHAEINILNMGRILLYVSRVQELRGPLARHSGFMDMLVRVASPLPFLDSRVARLKLLCNLANHDDNKVHFVETKGMLDAIMRIAALDVSENCREYASTVLMELASAADNQEVMTRSDKLLGTLVKLAVIEKVPETREAAISAIQNLAFCHTNRERLVGYGKGVVLEAMKKAISKDPYVKARRRAAGALTNLACDETSQLMGSHKGLLETLAIVTTRDGNSEVQMRASMALSKIASAISSPASPCYKTLLDALVVASLSPSTQNVSSVFRVKARDPIFRESMARHPGVLDTLADICVSSSYPAKDRDNAMRALMHLTNEEENRKIMCHKTVLDALVVGASLEGTKFEDMRESAIVALERLATDHSNRPRMARHSGLLTAVAKCTEVESKLDDAEVKATTHERLAKPLLMSLLLAL